MSAYVVSPDTVRLLVSVTDRFGLDTAMRDAYPHKDTSGLSDDELRGMLMRYVLSVNTRAVLYRYPTDTPDSVTGWSYEYRMDTDYRPLPVVDYEPVPFRVHDVSGNMSQSVARHVLGAAQCLSYQCCELPEWESTPAYRWLNRVVWRAASNLSEGWEVADIREAISA